MQPNRPRPSAFVNAAVSATGREATDDAPAAACVGVAGWKRAAVAAMLTPAGAAPPDFPRSARRAIDVARRRGGAIATWASREPAALQSLARAAGLQLIRVEDGFLRSRGLGAECRPPLSVTVDRGGLHFDPSRPSDLERLLSEARFDATLTARAERLVRRVVTLGLTKYNLSGTAPPPATGGRRTVLVPGQVAGDLSLRLGGAGVAGDLDLLRRARALEPDALLLYRPHPDVEAGLRKGGVRDADALRHADRIVRGDDLPRLLAGVDAVHVATSLTGFEALLRGREVVCHGQPFFAGWGLTRDLAPPPRRGRRLTATELAAAALILYPRYFDPQTGAACSPETAIERLAAPPVRAPAVLLPSLRRLQGLSVRAAAHVLQAA